MIKQINYLIELQSADDIIADLEAKLSEIPGKIDKSRSLYLNEQETLDSLKIDLETYSRERRAAERDLEVHEEKIRKLKEQQFMVKTNKEYQAFFHEIESMEEKKGALEETVLTLMEKISNIEKDKRSHEKRVLEGKERFVTQENKLKSDQAALERELEKARNSRAEIEKNVSKENLQKYARLYDFLEGKAVVAAVGGLCQGCFINLPPQKFQDVKKNEGIETCSQCKRILYFQEAKTEKHEAGKKD